MDFLWSSSKGAERQKNSDFLGIFHSADYLVCFLIDVAELTPQSSEFAENWSRYFISQVSAMKTIQVDDLIQALNECFERFRRLYLKEVASYCCLFLDKKSNFISSLSLGDCRVGRALSVGAEIFWQNSIHTLANALGEPLTDELLRNPARNVLTRALSARKFEYPVIEHIQLDNSMYLATDGFWVADALKNKGGDDDASVLRIDMSDEVFNFIALDDVKNYYVVTK